MNDFYRDYWGEKGTVWGEIGHFLFVVAIGAYFFWTITMMFQKDTQKQQRAKVDSSGKEHILKNQTEAPNE